MTSSASTVPEAMDEFRTLLQSVRESLVEISTKLEHFSDRHREVDNRLQQIIRELHQATTTTVSLEVKVAALNRDVASLTLWRDGFWPRTISVVASVAVITSAVAGGIVWLILHQSGPPPG